MSVTFDRSLCPLDAIYGAAYGFIDRYYVFLDAPGADKVRVRFKGRSPTTLDALEASAGEFANELLTHCWRGKLIDQNRPLLEALASQALAGALGTVALDDLGDGDLDDLESFNNDVFDDPLGIAESWEPQHETQPAAESEAPQERSEAEAGDKPRTS